MKKRILHLTLKKEWFDEIALKKKKIEYRQIKPYWNKRLLNDKFRFKTFDEVWFRNGYRKDSPFMRVECKDVCFGSNTHIYCDGTGINDGSNYAIHLGKILEIKRWKK